MAYFPSSVDGATAVADFILLRMLSINN
jgi:hypothetical protein